MKLDRGTGLLLLLAVAVAAAAFFAGRALRTPDGVLLASPEAAAFQPAPAIAGLSHGGFSGFGEVPGLAGQTVLSGRVTAIAPGAITVETPAGTTSSITLTGTRSLRRIEAGGVEALRPGVTVVVRLGGDGRMAEALLVLAEP